ncbi:MAG: response regulator [Myxococcales bacterium]|nr:response regulator [Myxococcales bacterium]
MVIIIVVVTVAAIIVVDLALRLIMNKVRAAKTRKEREAALDTGLRLNLTVSEAKSLKRVEVPEPKARILAVDDESVILDSFRKILVLAGYSVDTVESGPEALGLVRTGNYDFVFTDLKMPEMDGLEVTRAVKHLRPDIDVMIITGYATVETAVNAMKCGAMDYVEKPFTEDELVNFANASLIRRQDRIERQITPKVNLITPSHGPSPSKHEFNVPLGVFVSEDHTWVNIELNGALRIGLDDFASKLIGPIDDVALPRPKTVVKKGDPLFTIRQGEREITLPSPVSGTVSSVNSELHDNAELIERNPYEHGWMCCVEATNLHDDLRPLRIGAEALSWYREEIDKFMAIAEVESAPEAVVHTETGPPKPRAAVMSDKVFQTFSKTFLHAPDVRH